MKISDSHNDFLTGLKKCNREKYLFSLIKNKNIKRINCVVWTTKYKNPISKIKFFKKIQGKCNKFVFSIEDLGFINKNNFNKMIKDIVALKPFSCGIVWNRKNSLGGGSYSKGGLTLLGRKVIKILEKNNILVDTAHMNKKTFYDFCRMTTKPIFNSHCNFHFFNKHLRNINSNQIKKIINSNGFIGFSFVYDFICNKICDCRTVAKQMAFFISKYGDDYIGIGSDFFGTKHLPINLKSYDDMSILKKEMEKLGISKISINKIFYKNFENFLKQTIK